MRIVTLLAAFSALALLTASLPADAAKNDRARTRIIVKKRSYLDAGTTVKPGDKRYHDYIYSPELLYPAYGPRTYPYAGAARWPLPNPFELPGY
jgi:hypothetical protein